MNEQCVWHRAALAAAFFALVSCGGNTPPAAPAVALHLVGGSVSGLASGALVVLQNNGGDDLTITSNRAFQFPTAVAEGSGYRVSVLTQPAAQTCTLGRWEGEMGTADVTDVAVVCAANTYTIGGTVSGLAPGTSVTLQNNGGDNLVVNGTGGFTFPHSVADGGRYEVTVFSDPAGRRCEVANGTGDLSGANVTNVIVTCTPLCASGVCCDTGTGAFRPSSFPCGAATAYRCSSTGCGAQPQSRTSTQYCSGAAESCSGAVVDGPWTGIAGCTASQLCVSDGVSATCSTCPHGCDAASGTCWQQYTIGGTVYGLATGTSVTLQNNGGDNVVVNGNGGFTFTHGLVDRARYEVTVFSEPAGRHCEVASGSGQLNGANVTNVVVNCAPLCTSGVCCDTGTGAFRPSSFPCGAATAYRCSSTGCGAQAQARTSTQYCSGAAESCSGAVVDGAWTGIADCTASQLCVSDPGSATCSTCAHGCNAGAGACWPECNPAVDHCCSAAGTLTNCWYDPASGLEWQRDAATAVISSLSTAIASCQSLGAGWRVPTFAELRSLVRGCPSMQTGGACGITSACTASTCQAGCAACTLNGGGGEAGSYMPVGLTGLHRSILTYYWSTTTIPDRYSTTSGEAIWVLNFRDGSAWWDFGGQAQPRYDYVVRCVKGP